MGRRGVLHGTKALLLLLILAVSVFPWRCGESTFSGTLSLPVCGLTYVLTRLVAGRISDPPERLPIIWPTNMHAHRQAGRRSPQGGRTRTSPAWPVPSRQPTTARSPTHRRLSSMPPRMLAPAMCGSSRLPRSSCHTRHLSAASVPCASGETSQERRARSANRRAISVRASSPWVQSRS